MGWDSVWKSYCCVCFYQSEQAKAQEYSSYQQVYQRKLRERTFHIQQYQLLKNYLGCKQCGSLTVDAYHLYQVSKLVCQPCLMRKEGGSSSPISFLEQEKWYRKWWKVEIVEWLENYQCLPVNAECARKRLRDKEHLKNCDCLEREAKEIYLLFSNSLREKQEQLRKCACVRSEKVRVSSDDYAWCEKCEGSIGVASKKRVIKNRNDPRFWGIKSEWKILCLGCIGREFYGRMVDWQRKKWREYVRRGYV